MIELIHIQNAQHRAWPAHSHTTLTSPSSSEPRTSTTQMLPLPRLLDWNKTLLIRDSPPLAMMFPEVVENHLWVLAMLLLATAKINPVLDGTRTTILCFLPAPLSRNVQVWLFERLLKSDELISKEKKKCLKWEVLVLLESDWSTLKMPGTH